MKDLDKNKLFNSKNKFLLSHSGQINTTKRFFSEFKYQTKLNTKIKYFRSFNPAGQINQVFIFIMAIMVMGIIVLLATKSLGGLMGDKCEVDFLTFKDDISEGISSNNDYGSVNEIVLKKPCEYTTICLVDPLVLSGESNKAYIAGEEIKQEGKIPGAFIIGNSISNQVQTNVFLISQDGTETIEAGYIPQVKLEENILCINSTAGSFNMRTKGLGKYTLITKP